MQYKRTKQHHDYKNYLIDENGDIYSKINGYDNGIGYRLYKLKNSTTNKVDQKLGHRVTYEAWNEEDIPSGYEIHHNNYIRDDNHIDNLDCVTISANRTFPKKK